MEKVRKWVFNGRNWEGNERFKYQKVKGES